MSSWSFRDISLDTIGIVTLVSDSFKMPARRGGNILIPQRHGRIYVPKKYDQRSLSLGLEINEASIEELEAAIDEAKKLLGRRGRWRT
jgi:hypothetical protein